jgi:hypothetical protein
MLAFFVPKRLPVPLMSSTSLYEICQPASILSALGDLMAPLLCNFLMGHPRRHSWGVFFGEALLLNWCRRLASLPHHLDLSPLRILDISSPSDRACYFVTGIRINTLFVDFDGERIKQIYYYGRW